MPIRWVKVRPLTFHFTYQQEPWLVSSDHRWPVRGRLMSAPRESSELASGVWSPVLEARDGAPTPPGPGVSRGPKDCRVLTRHHPARPRMGCTPAGSPVALLRGRPRPVGRGLTGGACPS